ncbi:MAG TPA: type II toxin-antitoxin system VapC family toxin [Usitatibacteraceae bacterium]|nr:type II toxin-antitoxin system VapC family toxin [Usitatibacteraceae bacterium]
MIGLDSNVVVRYLVQDDAKQSAAATRLIEKTLTVEQPGFLSLITLAEIGWVLEECYGADRARVADVVEGLLSSRQLIVEQSEVAWRALRAWKDGPADLSDALIGQVGLAAGCAKVVTFDKGASRLGGFELLA